MPTSRAIVVLGMHRSGTSAITRGVAALGVYLGNDFLATQPDNPTGYWEDKGVVDISERVLAALGLRWEDVSLITLCGEEPELRHLRLEAVAYIRASFASHRLWGFKDPRTVRLLPFWQSVLRACDVDDAYVVAIRNPLSVAISLQRRQQMDVVTAHRLWLAYVVPFLEEIAGRPFVVVDYDLVMREPSKQLERIARALRIPLDEGTALEIDRFANGFLSEDLRHSAFSRFDFDTTAGVTPLSREAYLRLYELATDRLASDSPGFWSGWETLRARVESLIGLPENGRACS